VAHTPLTAARFATRLRLELGEDALQGTDPRNYVADTPSREGWRGGLRHRRHAHNSFSVVSISYRGYLLHDPATRDWGETRAVHGGR
jgi:hypothetical protein